MPSFNEVLGIDIGSHSVKIVHAQRGTGRYPTMESGWVRISDRYEDNRRLLQRFLETKGWSDVPAIVTLEGDTLLHRTVDASDHPGLSTGEILRQEVESLRGMQATEALHDHVEVQGPDKRTMLFVTYSRADAAAASMRLPEESGLSIVGLRPSATAIFNTVAHALYKERGVFLAVDLGHTTSTVVAGYRGNLLFARRFPGGAEHFPKELRTRRNLAFEESSEDAALRTTTIQISSEMLEELDQRIMEWIEALNSCIALFRSRFPSEAYAPERIILCGGGASIGTVRERVEMSLGITTESLSDMRLKDFPEDLGRYAAATGLALAGVGRDRAPIDLLPSNRKEDISLQWQRAYWISGAAALMTGLLLLLGGALFYLNQLEKRIQHFLDTREQINRLELRIAARTRDTLDLQKQITPLRLAVNNGHQMMKLLEALNAARAPNDWFTYIADQQSYVKNTPLLVGPRRSGEEPPVGALTSTLQINKVIVEGFTPEPDLSTVRNMLETLRAVPAISQADLLPDDRVRSNSDDERLLTKLNATRFALEITLAAP